MLRFTLVSVLADLGVRASCYKVRGLSAALFAFVA